MAMLTEAQLFAELGLGEAHKQKLQSYLQAVLKWNKVYNLTAVTKPNEAWRLHILDSLAALHAWKGLQGEEGRLQESKRVLDVGTGAGLPGVVWAVAQPDWEVTCVDAVAKKIGFIRQAAAELQIGNVRPLHVRIEEHDEQYHMVTSRAFTSLQNFVSLTKKHVFEGGQWVALKSKLVDQELQELKRSTANVFAADDSFLPDQFHVKHFDVPGVEAERSIVVISR